MQVCTFLHQVFIENPMLMKLVHFQGYHPQLLPIVVFGVHSMHICLDFLPELLNQPFLERQIFGIKLAGYLVEKYPLPKWYFLFTNTHTKVLPKSSLLLLKPIFLVTHSVDLSRLVMQKMHNAIVSADSPAPFLLETLPSLVRMVNTFPSFLAEEAVNLLLGKKNNKKSFAVSIVLIGQTNALCH